MIHSTFHLKIWLKKWIYCYWENSDRFLHLKLLKSLHWYINQLTWFHLILNIFGQTYNVYFSYHMPLWLLYSLVKAKHTYLKLLFLKFAIPCFFWDTLYCYYNCIFAVETCLYRTDCNKLLKLVCGRQTNRQTDRLTDIATYRAAIAAKNKTS